MPLESVRDVSEPGRRAMVGWSDGKVQVGAVNSNVQLVRSVEFDEKGTAREATDKDPLDGWFVDLDRKGINRMIRLLRAARDNAFGTDA